ncbi:MerR family transcriptional regulator [Haloimpatiens massiliensis]|uniref:MerR family transcriptional regulator n=1 Tax=Haloimpatiens massiliensis TaxID=1658110 RepID=UPI000C81A066|nr:MerR family transcriptional regulator [Haloimpatiens massiliensis]
MYSIGQFSLILKVSTRTLRHYDEIGLLNPSFVSKENNYRYYEKEQINSAKYIIKLKESGLTLDEIKDIIFNKDSNNFKETIEKRLMSIEEEIQKLITMKDNLGILLKEDKTENKQHSWDQSSIKIVMKDELCVISKRVRINIRNVGETIGILYEEINKNGLRITGGHIIKYYDLEYDPDNADIEVSIPVERRKESKIKFNYIPAGRYAIASSSSISEKGDIHAMVIDWIQLNNYEVVGEPLEQYNITYDNGKFKIDVYYPIK